MSHPLPAAGCGTTGGKASILLATAQFVLLREGPELTRWCHSDGDPGWTGAPPLQDSIMEISKIEMYYNRTSSAGTC